MGCNHGEERAWEYLVLGNVDGWRLALATAWMEGRDWVGGRMRGGESQRFFSRWDCREGEGFTYGYACFGFSISLLSPVPSLHASSFESPCSTEAVGLIDAHHPSPPVILTLWG